MKLHLIMPMAGAGSRFFKNGYMVPKPLIELDGKPFLYWATEAIRANNDIADITFIVLKDHIERFKIDKVIKDFYPYAFIVALPEVTEGATITCLKGLEHISEEDTLPVLFNDCDHTFKSSALNSFLSRPTCDIDAGLLTFQSNDPAFSYIKYDENRNIVGTIEKKVVSDEAIAGAYLFKNGGLFRDLAEEYMKNCAYKEFFVSGVYNVLCNRGGIVKNFRTDWHLPFGTPDELNDVLADPNSMKHLQEYKSPVYD